MMQRIAAVEDLIEERTSTLVQSNQALETKLDKLIAALRVDMRSQQ